MRPANYFTPSERSISIKTARPKVVRSHVASTRIARRVKPRYLLAKTVARTVYHFGYEASAPPGMRLMSGSWPTRIRRARTSGMLKG